MCRKHSWKRRAISSLPHCFKRLILETRKSQCLFGKGLKQNIRKIFICHLPFIEKKYDCNVALNCQGQVFFLLFKPKVNGEFGFISEQLVKAQITTSFSCTMMFGQSFGTMDVNIGCRITRKRRGIHDWVLENTDGVVYLSVILCYT